MLFFDAFQSLLFDYGFSQGWGLCGGNTMDLLEMTMVLSSARLVVTACLAFAFHSNLSCASFCSSRSALAFLSWSSRSLSTRSSLSVSALVRLFFSARLSLSFGIHRFGFGITHCRHAFTSYCIFSGCTSSELRRLHLVVMDLLLAVLPGGRPTAGTTMVKLTAYLRLLITCALSLRRIQH